MLWLVSGDGKERDNGAETLFDRLGIGFPDGQYITLVQTSVSIADHGRHCGDSPVVVLFRISGGAGICPLGRVAVLFETGSSKTSCQLKLSRRSGALCT